MIKKVPDHYSKMVRLKIYILHVSLSIIFFSPSLCYCQDNRSASDEVKDSIISKFNRSDFKGIYLLFDTSFSNKITEPQLVNFLKGNQNSGKVVKSSFKSEDKELVSYLLEFELRDMVMNLKITPGRKISDFGLFNPPPIFLKELPFVKTNNPKKSSLDLAIDSLATEYFRYANANSLAIGVIKNGNKHYYFYGETEKGNGHLPTLKTIYELGSITKTFTATVFAQAILDGKVSIKDDVQKYLGKEYSNLKYNDIPVTLVDLANHTSRLPTLPPDIGETNNYDPLQPEAHYDSTRFFNALRQLSLDTVPGFKFLYSNWGISLLGHILENLYAQNQSVLVKRFVTSPLKMGATGYITNAGLYDMALPHSENNKRLPLTDQGYFSPAGGLCSSVEDMMKYLDAQLKETMPSIRLTHVPTSNSMGLGWGTRKIDTTRDLQHNGSEQGSTANISAYPEINSGCVIFVNNKVNLSKLIVGIQNILKSSRYK